MFAIPRHTYVSIYGNFITNYGTGSILTIFFKKIKESEKYSKNEILWHGVLLCVLVARKNDKPEF